MERFHWALKGILFAVLFLFFTRVFTPLVESRAIIWADIPIRLLIVSAIASILFWVETAYSNWKKKKDTNSKKRL